MELPEPEPLQHVPRSQLDVIEEKCYQCRMASPHMLRCGQCRVAHYCSKDCQREHWKEHKVHCQHTMANNPDNAPAPTIPSYCENCDKFLETLHPLLCSRCKNSIYCSRECQKEHWKEHKRRCNTIAGVLESLNDLNLVGMFERFSEWERHSQVHLQLAVSSALTPAQYETQPPEVVTFLRLDFDFNLLTFRPFAPAHVARTSDLPDLVGHDQAKSAMEHYESARAKVRRNLSAADADQTVGKTHLAFLRCLDTWALSTPTIPQHFQPCDWERVQAFFGGECRYKTHQVDPWRDQRQATVQVQIVRLRSECPEFVPFVHYAFRLHSRQPMHNTHGILVYFDFAFGLGKVGRLVQYKAVALEVLRDTLHFDEAAKLNILGGEDSPILRESREECPHNVLLSVVFVNTATRVTVCCPNFCPRNPEKRYNVPVQLCDEKADELFAALQRFQFPDVTSPELR